MLKIAYDPIYKYQLPEGHRFPMEKYDILPEQLIYEGTVENHNFFAPKPLTDTEILLTHSADYLQKLNTLNLNAKEIRNIGFPMSETLVRRGKYIAGGTYQCALHAMEHGVAMNIAGGTHHSFRDRGEGFCLFNDIAIASNLLLHQGKSAKILVIDLDVHQGNGTASIFGGDERVFTLSVHGEKNYPTRKEISDLDIGMVDHCDDITYLSVLYATLPRLIETVQPDFVFYLAGVDVLKSDKLGRLDLTKKGCKERDRFVLTTVKSYGVPMAISMGGGYSVQLSDIIDAHANTFRLAQEIYF